MREEYGKGEGGKNREGVSCEAEVREKKEYDKIKVREQMGSEVERWCKRIS